MAETYLTINQHLTGPSYRDVIARICPIPADYLSLVTVGRAHFVYCDPKHNGDGEYFGCGQIGEILWESEAEEEGRGRGPGSVIAIVNGYREFVHPVPIEREDGSLREGSVTSKVRKIPRKLFQEIAAQGGEKVSFIADAHLMQVLGEQLIGSEKVGILELIKNAYDAGAKNCRVLIEKVPGLPNRYPESDEWVSAHDGPVVSVVDDGSGMDRDTIVNGWLRPATTIRTSVKERLKAEREKAEKAGTEAEYERIVQSLREEHGGRLPLGEKGVGRLATHRLGRHLLLLTKTADDPLEWALQIDWDRFDAGHGEAMDLSEVGLSLEHQRPTFDYGPGRSGTVLRVYGGRPGFEWDEPKLRDIAHAVALLQSPVRAPTGFSVEFRSQHLEEPAVELLTEAAPAPFVCRVLVDQDGIADIDIEFVPPPSLSVPMKEQQWNLGSIDLRAKNYDYWRMDDKKDLRTPRCGPFFAQIRCWLRVREWVHGADWRTLGDYLEKYGGIAVFRDGLNIVSAETGAERDWLGLATEHIKKGSKISYYNLLGGVELQQHETLHLVDKTSREGMLETVPFRDLGELVKTVVDELQLRVQQKRDEHRELRKRRARPVANLKKRGEQAKKVMLALAENYDVSADPAKLRPVLGKDEPRVVLEELSETLRDLGENIALLESEVDGLVEASGFGLSIGIAVHEIEKLATAMAASSSSLLSGVPGESPFKPQLREIVGLADALLSEVKRIAPFRVTRTEGTSRFKIRDAILAAMGAFGLTWKDMAIDAPSPLRSEDFEVNQRFGACTQIFANLLDNATYWLGTMPERDRPRKIQVKVLPDERRVIVADNGPGVADRIREHLFKPFYSLKSPGSGLGLYICKHYMTQMKGNIREARPEERIADMPGAQFVILFPRKRRAK